MRSRYPRSQAALAVGQYLSQSHSWPFGGPFEEQAARSYPALQQRQRQASWRQFRLVAWEPLSRKKFRRKIVSLQAGSERNRVLWFAQTSWRRAVRLKLQESAKKFVVSSSFDCLRGSID